MKKVLGLLFLALVLNSCGSKAITPLAKCETSAAKYSDALTAFIADFTSKSKCEAFKSATNTYLSACTTLTTVEVKKAKDEISSLDCTKL